MAYDSFMIVETAHANFAWSMVGVFFACVLMFPASSIEIIEIFTGAVCGAGPGFRAPRAARGRANLTHLCSCYYGNRHLSTCIVL